jgi:Site-specific DNA methylase
MTLGSLFDGIGGFPLAGMMCSITPVWASEIEPFPMKVTAARFPEMKQLGSVTDINGAEVEPVDVITFGSPCQDLSVAGKQLGIHEGQRSNLFFEAVRIIKEMRDAEKRTGRADDDIRPRFAVWENVPGAFSSNGGEDFRAVLEALASISCDGVSIPRPKKWNNAGCMVGNGWSIAWRVYDAQYWGVPQRRKRIYLVADFASERAGEILFERESVSGDSPQSRTPWEGTAADAEGGAGGGNQPVCLTPWDSQGNQVWDGVNDTHYTCLRGQGEAGYQAAYVLAKGTAPEISQCQEIAIDAERSVGRSGAVGCDLYNGTVTGETVIAFDCRSNVSNEEVSGTLQAKSTGGYSLNYQNPVCYRKSTKPRDAQDDERWQADGVTNTLNTFEYSDVRTTEAIVYPKVTGALCANSHPGSYTGQDAFNDMLPVVPADKPPRKYIVRRLTPTECAKLQGMPWWWCEGLGGSDSAIYKAYGNGLALPCAYDVLRRIAKECDGGVR